MIKVEYVTKQPGRIEEVAVVNLEGQDTKTFTIKGNIVERSLEVLSVSDEQPLKCIKFGSTYYGTDRTECALLHNNGPEPVNFVAMLDEDAIAQELGVDLTQTTKAALAEEDGGIKQGSTNVLTSLVTAIPNQGTLKPFEKIPIFFRFSPRWNMTKQGWKSQIVPPPRKDYAVFMRLEIIGSRSGFNHGKGKKGDTGGSFAEIALTGTALPVLLSISPTHRFDFGECPVKEHADTLCTIRNESNTLPAIFQFRRIAHFTAHPPNGRIHAGQIQDVIFSFSPRQIGTFQPEQLLDIIGQVADPHNPTLSYLQVIYTLPVQFLGRSEPVTKVKSPKFNPGLTPLISNEIGMFVDTTFATLKNGYPRNAVAGAPKTKLHRLRLTRSAEMENEKIRVAFPNDRTYSIRPSEKDVTFQTLFTRKSRHNFVDPDYAYTDDEKSVKSNHRNQYVGYFSKWRETRETARKGREFDETNNKIDIGIKSAAGLKPKRLTSAMIGPDPPELEPPNAGWKVLSAKEMKKAEREALIKPIVEGLNAVPVSAQEKADCKKRLSPQQLHQLIIGPPTIEFGQVCLRSTTQQDLSIINNLDQHVHVVAHIDCRELRQSSPLSQVVPPKSKATIPIIFESNTKGKFQRSVTYTVNGFYEHHVTVVAEVVAVALELSAENLVLRPSPGLPAEAGFRGVITLFNKLNYPAEFTWQPNLGEKGTAFSIRPATGVVDPFTDLDCEVVWHPSYLAPEDGSFTLHTHGGEPKQLSCLAELGPASVHFVERRVLFGMVPVNLTTVRTVLLHNSGPNHAYFQVLDSNPVPGLTISPVHGVIPVGGKAELKVALTPDAILKFDTKVQVAIKQGKVLELRMGGTVESPCVDIDVPHFSFGGVYCGSGSVVPFKLINKGNTRAKVEFDLTRYKDFTLVFPGYQTSDDFNYQMLNPGMFSATLAPQEKADGELTFTPTEVAAYDFRLPVVINHTGAPSPAPTPFPPTPAPSQKNSLQHIIKPRPTPVNVHTPSKHVIATAMRQPLQLSHNRIEFSVPASVNDMSLNVGSGASDTIILVNNSDRRIKWALDLSKSNKALDEGVFKFTHPSGVPFIRMAEGESLGIEGELDPGQTQPVAIAFCPVEPGKYECIVPVVLDDVYDKPYQYIQVLAELKQPKIWFEPVTVVLTPVPLLTKVSEDFNIRCSQYRQMGKLSVQEPEVECEDGSKISPIKVTFPKGNEIQPCSSDEGQPDPSTIPCKVTFCSDKPVSFTEPIIFTDDQGRSFQMYVSAMADNCLLTCYPYLAQHRTDHQIICEQGSSPKSNNIANQENRGEAVFVPCQSPKDSNSRPSTSATSSNFQVSTSSFESSASVTDSTEQSTPIARDGALNKPPSGSDKETPTQELPNNRSVGSAMFPDEDSEEGIFHLDVLMAVQRWFSSNGWPGGPFPIIIPETLRSGISRKLNDDEVRTSKGSSSQSKGGCRTVYDMIGHLSGRPVPGIPLNSLLPTDPVERVKQIYWQHSTLLTFLRCQGACLASVRPEYLMEPRDFSLWCQLQRQIKMELMQQNQNEEAAKILIEDDLDEVVFEAISKRAWTDVLLQTLKCLVLAKVTPRTLKSMESPDKNVNMPSINPDPLSSNIYSVGERILLAWLNHHYEHNRHKVWENCSKGGIPPARWVVNFDFDLLDGLVLGAVLGAHMPFLIKSHLSDMYSHPSTAEQCLHNALKVVNAMRYVGIDYDVQAIDITDPNPIALLMLCIHLYQRLPQYLAKSDIEFTGTLHATVTRQVKLSNPSTKPLVYQVLLAGRDARDFSVPKGDAITIPPKSTYGVPVEFKSRFLRPAEAVLVLIGRRQGSTTGTTLTFNLRTQIDNITPVTTVRVESSCYELERIMLQVTNPFKEAGEFRIMLVEASGDILDPSKPNMLLKPKEKKRKKVRSKTDHGQPRAETPPSPPPAQIKEPQESILKKEDDNPTLSAFFCPNSTIYLEPTDSVEVEVDFLPFTMGDRQCSVIFLNESIGEFLYSIEAKAGLPLPSVLPYVPSPHSVRISSAAAAGSGRGFFGGDERVIYWKCELGQTLREKLLIPVTNMKKERALIMAAQQHMSDIELQRRHVTGTLMSSSVTSQTIKKLSTNPESSVKQAKKRTPQTIVYTIDADNDLFRVPDTLVMPSPLDGRVNSAPSNVKIPSGLNLDDGVVELPVEFNTSKSGLKAGHYPCRLILQGPDDMRVYQIECTVNPQGSTAELEFTAPVHQSITQEIPIVNMTNNDWPLKVTITGEGFSGPRSLLAKAYQITKYPLVFKPYYEKKVTGKLLLTNTEDGTDHTFHLCGQGETPLALERVRLNCEAKSSMVHSLKVPNVTKKKLSYRVECDIPFVSGNSHITVLPGQTGIYNVVLSPRRRGLCKGVISFIAGKNPVKDLDSDGDEMPEDETVEEYYGYRVWYALEFNVLPAAPERTLDVVCCCHKKVVLEVIVRNPTVEDIKLDATIRGHGLTGGSSISLGAGEKDVYTLEYAPFKVGHRKGSLTFYNEAVGEFWYELNLRAEPPAPTTLPHMECELGRWTKQDILLENPTSETLELIPTISNTNNFSLERDNERPIVLQPQSSLEIPLHFMPSSLGQGDHLAKIIFNSEQLGEWVFVASGTGRLPQPQDPVSVFTVTGTSTNIIIPFRNPLDIGVLADIQLTDTTERSDEDLTDTNTSPFTLLLKHMKVHVGPKSTIDIPISFSPVEIEKYTALCTVVVRREDGEDWTYIPKEDEGSPYAKTSQGLSEIRWLYPLKGVPELKPVRESQSVNIECRARDIIEQRLEVTLTGVAPSSSGPQKKMLLRAKTPERRISADKPPDGVVVGDKLSLADEYTYEILYSSKETRVIMDNALFLDLVRQNRDPHTGLVTLMFNVKFSPSKAMKSTAELLVNATTGGRWRFPMQFEVTEPPVDDVIMIEATGLNKDSGVKFRLSSTGEYPTAFNAYFDIGSDSAFTVSPTTGHLQTEIANGTEFIVTFHPTSYGRPYQAKLIIKSTESQWSYNLRGVLPEYVPPRGKSSQPMAGPHPDPRLRPHLPNYILENKQLLVTAASSPIKGGPLVQKQQYPFELFG